MGWMPVMGGLFGGVPPKDHLKRALFASKAVKELNAIKLQARMEQPQPQGLQLIVGLLGALQVVDVQPRLWPCKPLRARRRGLVGDSAAQAGCARRLEV